MGFNSKILLSLVLLVVAVPLMVDAFVWNVGDDAGWSGEAQFNYTNWAMRPAFLVGDDSLRFVYNPSTTNVLEVTSNDYESCDATSPLATYNTGYDTVPLTKLHQYFISGNPVYCNNGLKVDIPASNSSFVRFWRLGPTYDDNGYVNIPKFEATSSEGENTTQTISSDSNSSAALTPTMSPDSTETGGEEDKTQTLSPNSPTSSFPSTSSASTFSSNSLLLVLAAALVVPMLGSVY